jgi:hypothetical protein
MDSSSEPGQSRSRKANKPNWRLTLRRANKPKSKAKNRGDMQKKKKKKAIKVFYFQFLGQ